MIVMSGPSFFLKELQRTNDDFTTGIVNIPLDTPAFVYFVVDVPEEKFWAQELLSYQGIEYEYLPKKKHNIIISKNVVHRDYIKHMKDMNTHELTIKTKVVDRYLFFELDNKDPQQIDTVLAVYKMNNIPVYYHETMRGYHFMSVKPIREELYHKLLSQIKPLNVLCPHVTLRIKPNKWVGEREVFKSGHVWESPHIEDIPFNEATRELARWMEFQHIGLIKKKYFVVHYRQTGELANL